MFIDDPDASLADLVDGSIGELSLFHDTFGVYAQGVDETTAILPSGWKDRLVTLCNENTGAGEGLCLEPYDLCASKLCAFREKDLQYVDSLLVSELINKDILIARIATIVGHDDEKRLALSHLGA
ncbi:MAG: hypothetical protein LBI64_01595 [Coriobacteriales bacterium]|jgi:hypothetical protein|nr:hypothetical protein [Coriobacteriales bacterium]